MPTYSIDDMKYVDGFYVFGDDTPKTQKPKTPESRSSVLQTHTPKTLASQHDNDWLRNTTNTSDLQLDKDESVDGSTLGKHQRISRSREGTWCRVFEQANSRIGARSRDLV